MAGYIGANTSSVTNNQNAAERRKKFTFTANTTALTGLNFAANKIHIFHNGIRLVKDTDFTEAADGKSVTLTNAAQAGDEVVAVTFAQDPASNSDFVSALSGGTFSGDVTMASGTTLDASAGLTTPAGHVIQAQSTFYNTEQIITSTGYTDIMSVNITPKSNTSKVLVIVHLQCNHEDFHGGLVKVLRDSTAIGGGTGGGSFDSNVWFTIREANQYHTQSATGQFLDSPSTTSQITYKVQGSTTNSSYPTYINRTRYGNNSQRYASNNGSSITVMEIAQ